MRSPVSIKNRVMGSASALLRSFVPIMTEGNAFEEQHFSFLVKVGLFKKNLRYDGALISENMLSTEHCWEHATVPHLFFF